MNPSPWQSEVAGRYDDAASAWHEAGYADAEQPHFWELTLDLGEETLERAAQEIVSLARNRQFEHAHACCLVLLHILRTRLSNIRGNHLWPEVARELTALASQHLDGD